MDALHLHIIAFDIPYPPLYGGVIDVFYQIKALSEAGVKVHLHAYEYGKGQRSEELEKYCFRVHYYRRRTDWTAAMGKLPYIVASRKSDFMMDNLMKDNYPILFEGLHTCYHIDDKRLKGRLKLVRTTNIEHRYYANLALAERNIIRKIYFSVASLKLRLYQKVLHNADYILPVSDADTLYFQTKFPGKEIMTLTCFHGNTEISHETKRGNCVLFQGNLEVAENEKAAIYLIQKVMHTIDAPFLIAGKSPSLRLTKIAAKYPNVQIIASPDETTMAGLIRKARINLLITFQATGLKLKLLNALYNSNVIIANSKMLHGTGLDELCYIADTAQEIRKQIALLIQYDTDIVSGKTDFRILLERYNNQINTAKLIRLLHN